MFRQSGAHLYAVWKHCQITNTDTLSVTHTTSSLGTTLQNKRQKPLSIRLWRKSDCLFKLQIHAEQIVQCEITQITMQ